MADPTTARAGQMIVRIESADSPNDFIAPCGFTSKAFNIGKNLSEILIKDCNDPDAAAWLARDVQSKTASITGEGLLAAEAVPTWLGLIGDDDGRQCEVEIGFATGTLTYIGNFHLEGWNISSDDGQRVTSNITLQSDGAIVSTWTPNSP